MHTGSGTKDSTMESQREVSQVGATLQRFGWVDYVVFVIMLAMSAFVGVYWGFIKKQKSQQDYLMGGRNMKVFPVSMSLVARYLSVMFRYFQTKLELNLS